MKDKTIGHILTFGVLVGFTSLVMLRIAESYELVEMLSGSSIFIVFSTFGVLSANILWIWMFYNYFFVNRKIVPSYWGLLLIFCNWVAAPFYFYLIYIRNNMESNNTLQPTAKDAPG